MAVKWNLFRANEMLTVLDALIPIFLGNTIKDRKADMKNIREIIHQLSQNIKTIVHNSDKLAQWVDKTKLNTYI